MDRKNGFTLVELLVAISLIGILSTMAGVIFSKVTEGIRDSVRMKDLQAIKQALELYRNDNRFYPTTNGLVLSTATSLNSGGVTYLAQIPKDSKSDRSYYYLASPSSCDNTGINYCSSFILCAKREGISTAYDLLSCNSLNSSSNYCGSAGNCDIGISSQ